MNGTSSDEPVVRRRRARGTATTQAVDDTRPAEVAVTETGNAEAATDAGNGEVTAQAGEGPAIVAPGAPDETRLVWVDMEMTGLRPEIDRIIEVAVVVTDSELQVLADLRRPVLR